MRVRSMPDKSLSLKESRLRCLQCGVRRMRWTIGQRLYRLCEGGSVAPGGMHVDLPKGNVYA